MLITYFRYGTSVYKDNKFLKSHKTIDIKVFLIFMLVRVRIRIREAQKRTDPTEHCAWENSIYLLRLSFMLQVMWGGVPWYLLPT